jgi:EAL domain-containing protein (putative c-di-GMP-specific phosphodiesterase class I)
MGIALTEWALEQLQKHLRNWKTVGLQPVPIGVKASLAALRPTELAHLVNGALAGGMPARGLSLQLQQLGAIDNLPTGESAALADLRKTGVRLALDRFGHTASVAHLRKLMCDEIRVDASFLANLPQDAALQAMLLGIGDLARRLHVPCVACGVDTAAQLAVLKENGWGQAQGAMFDAPLSGLAFAAKWLTRGGKPARLAVAAQASDTSGHR